MRFVLVLVGALWCAACELGDAGEVLADPTAPAKCERLISLWCGRYAGCVAASCEGERFAAVHLECDQVLRQHLPCAWAFGVGPRYAACLRDLASSSCREVARPAGPAAPASCFDVVWLPR